MGKVSIDTTWLSGIEDAPLAARTQFYGALMAYVIDGEAITPKDKQAAFAWKCVLPMIRKSLAISKVRSEARKSATKTSTKREQTEVFCHQQNAEQNCDTCPSTNEGFCCEQNTDKIGLSGSVSGGTSHIGNVVKPSSSNNNHSLKSAVAEPLDPSKTNENEAGAGSNIYLSNSNNNFNNTIEKENREINKEKKESEKPVKMKYAEHVSMTEDEFAKLMANYGKEQTIWMINKLNAYKGSKNKTYKSDYLAILNWVVGEYEKQNKNNNGNKVNTRLHPGGTSQAPADYGNSTI